MPPKDNQPKKCPRDGSALFWDEDYGAWFCMHCNEMYTDDQLSERPAIKAQEQKEHSWRAKWS